jgi:hypothetical protein
MNKRLRLLAVLAGLLLTGTMSLRAQHSPDELVKHIQQLQQTVQLRKSMVSSLRPDRPHELPIGIASGNDDRPAILIDELVLYPDHAEFKAYAALKIPGSPDAIYLATPNPVALTYNGGLLGTARMELVKERNIKLPGAGDAVFTVKSGNTFLEFNCSGFKQAGLGVAFELPSKLIPADGSPGRVKGSFAAVFSDLNNILAECNIAPFEVKGVPGLTFTVSDAVIDMNDYANALSMQFPADYQAMYLPGVDPSLWRGFYIRKASVQLPEELKDRSLRARKELGVQNLLIDAQGLSGDVFGTNIIAMKNGDLGGWDYSIDEVTIGFIANQLKRASLKGGINIPTSAEVKSLSYSCLFHPGKEYIFNVTAADSLNFTMFNVAKLSLRPGSIVEVALKGKKFEAMANLSGQMQIGTGLSGSDSTGNYDFSKEKDGFGATIRFEQLVLSTKAPYIHSGVFDGGAQVKLGNFKASMDRISLVKEGEKRGFNFDLKVNLMGSKDASNGFAADASLTVWGKVTADQQERQRYQYAGTSFSRISINIDQGSFSLKGSLNFFKQDATFGNGFKGMITASMKPGITVGATALFGKVDDLNYWYADALATFPVGIPVAPPLELDGFAGGLYYAVKQKPGNGGNIAIVNSQTGLAYLPDASAGLGVRAAVRFGLTGKKDLFNGNVGFEIAFHKGGGLSRVSFMGNANFMQDPLADTEGDIKAGSKVFASTTPGSVNNTSAFDQMNKRGALSASVLIDYNADNNTLFANFKAYINVAGGALRGVNAGGLAGEGTLYFGPDGWYVHIGTPTAPVGVELLGFAKTSSYFMVGKDLPGSPPPPPQVSEILGGRDLDYMRDLNALGKGKGIAFGAGLHMNTGDLTFLIFYARFAAGLGFDVMLKDYGTSAQCEGGGPIGINGWYANGQVYAYLQGKIGIKVKVFRKNRKFDIIDLGAAAVLQAKLPNPVWMRGIVGGYYRILGGLVKGKCSFEFTLGKECKIVGTDAFAEAGVQVIAEVNPVDKTKDVDVFSIPQALFNIPVGKEFAINDDSGKPLLFRSRLDEFSVKDGATPIPGTQEWNADQTVVAFTSAEILPANRTITVTAKISFEENQNGSWKPYLVEGKPYVEQVSNSFVSGTAPDNIPLSNIAYSYPVVEQLNYYKNETKKGYIKLKRGQSYLFDPASDFRQVGRLLSATGTVKEFDIAYTNNEVQYTLPEISNDLGYELAIIAVPKTSTAAIDRNVKTEETKLVSSGESDLTITTRSSVAALKKEEERQTFLMSFRSSKYNTFSEKIDGGSGKYSYTWPLRNGVHELGYAVNTPELFDDFEINDEGRTPLVRLEADLSENAWYKEYIFPYAYDRYPATADLAIQWRSPVEKLGAPPVRAAYIKHDNAIYGLRYTAPQVTATPGKAAFVYNLSHYMERDYLEVQWKLANAIAGGRYLAVTPKMQSIIQTPFMPVRKGSYVLKASYTLPGTHTVTSVKSITINNEIGY